MIGQFALPIVTAIGFVACLLIILLLPNDVFQSRSQHLRSAIQRLEEQKERGMVPDADDSANASYDKVKESKFIRLLLILPGAEAMLNFIDRSGMIGKLDNIILITIGIFITLAVLLSAIGPVSIIVSGLLTFGLVYFYLNSKIKKRRQLFLTMLPDALDIIVRSVRSGYPINAAIGMVADSLPREVGVEFLRIMHEASYGYTLGEAIERFSDRMNEPDVSFFSVVVNLQQETGGNLAEILSNLSGVIRQRQQLRLKIRALSAEGRITVVILVGIALCMVAAVQFMAPGHFDRLFSTSAGQSIMMACSFCFVLAFITIRKIINFKI